MERLGAPLPETTDYRPFIGPPLHVTFRALCAGDEAAALAGVAHFRERYGTIGLFENRLYDGVPEMLAALAHHALFVCTSKPGAYATRIVEHFRLTSHFRAIYGSELDGTRADKAELIAWLLASEGFAAADAAMIGDREHDARGARANGVTPYGVLWGYGSAAELQTAGAREIFAAPADVQRWFAAG